MGTNWISLVLGPENKWRMNQILLLESRVIRKRIGHDVGMIGEIR